jgi:peptidoglycan hydrolase-like protein with peptidoglycan-binding domain
MPLSKPYPVLSFGSAGEAVRLLQQALNLGPTKLPRLQDDASFGPKTLGRVTEFQGQKNLTKDGVVGPVTWGELGPFVEQLLKLIDKNLPASGDEATQRQRIVDIAQASFEQWGWGEAGHVTCDGSVRIAAAQGVGPSLGGRRARQGGATLASIYAMAGAGGANCLTIASDIEAIYQQNPNDPVAKAKRRDAINQQDIGSWCGIFATYCYRASGLKIAWDQVRAQSSTYFEPLLPTAAVQKGDIGVFDPQTNHHFLVIKDAAPGERVYSIDGNVGNPSEMVVSPWNSVISKRFYLRTTLAGKSGKFLRPKFAAMK